MLYRVFFYPFYAFNTIQNSQQSTNGFVLAKSLQELSFFIRLIVVVVEHAEYVVFTQIHQCVQKGLKLVTLNMVYVNNNKKTLFVHLICLYH